jgi:hypothetical protein
LGEQSCGDGFGWDDLSLSIERKHFMEKGLCDRIRYPPDGL